MKKILLFSMMALPLTGCGIYKKYDRQPDVPADLFGAVQVADTASLGNLPWQQLFTDPELQSLIEEGLSRNTDLQTAQLRVEQAEATLTASKLAFLPSFALAPQGNVSSFDGGKAVQSYTLPVAASWQVDLFGGLLNAKRQAKESYLISEAYRQAVRTRLIASIANTYYTLLMLDTQYRISQETSRKWEEGVRTAKALKQAGMYTEAGVAQMEATYYNIQTSLEDLKEQINQTQNSMALLLAVTPRDFKRGTLEAQQFSADLSVGVPIQLLANRPDVRSAEHAIAQAYYGVAQARSAFYPSITLSGTAGWTNSAGAMILNPGKLIASAVGSLTQPLFNKGLNSARLKIAKAQQEEAQLQFNQTLLSAGSEVNNALTRYQTAQRKAALYDHQISSLETAVKSTRLLMQHGNTNYLEVLTAQQSLLTAQLTQTANRFSEIQGLINLYQALGGGR
ncbi:MAG: TolC family protein [Bacteroidales bacterium]